MYHSFHHSLEAVHSDDLDSLLNNLGLTTEFQAGKLKCKFCKDIVTQENIYSVMKDSGSYKLVCDKAECVAQLMQFITDRKNKTIR